MFACLYGAYLIVGINCHQVALIRKYMYGYTYMEVFSCNLEPDLHFVLISVGLG